MSNADAAFILGVAGSFVASWVLTVFYIWPAVRELTRDEALKILALPHAFRFIGLSFLVEGVVSAELESEFTVPAAWGDFGAANLALLSIAALRWRWSIAIPLVWLFNLWGTIDLLYANVNAVVLKIEPGQFGAAYYIPTIIVPLLLLTHAAMFVVLLRRDGAGAER